MSEDSAAVEAQQAAAQQQQQQQGDAGVNASVDAAQQPQPEQPQQLQQQAQVAVEGGQQNTDAGLLVDSGAGMMEGVEGGEQFLL